MVKKLLKNKQLPAIGVVLLLLVAIPLTVAQLQRQAELQSKAQSAPTPTAVPSFEITTPVDGDTVTGQDVLITAPPNLAVGHHGVAFYLNGDLIGSDETAPYSITWDSTTAENGTHVLEAKEAAEEDALALASSETVEITVANGTNDTTPPVISNLSTTELQSNFAIISWQTNENATSQVEYGKTQQLGLATQKRSVLGTNHSHAISDLEPNTKYYYRVKSNDAAGNGTVSSINSFTTQDEIAAEIGAETQMIQWPFSSIHSILLYTGEVLLWGTSPQASSTYLFNPTNQSLTGVPIPTNLFCSGHATLADGRILAAGGHISDANGHKNTTIYNPASRTWSSGPTMAFGRWYPSLTVLPNGQTSIINGLVNGNFVRTPEVYTDSTNSLHQLTTIQTNQLGWGTSLYVPTFLLPNGKIFTYSGTSVNLLDVPATSWTSAPTSPVNSGSAAQYRPGKILVAGGANSNGTTISKAAVIDMNSANPSWRTINSMKYNRYFHSLVNLPDGKVLAVGGADNTSTSAQTGVYPMELWDPNTEQWTTLAPIQALRLYHSTAVLLPDGRVLISGGNIGSNTNKNAELYSPPYLEKGTRPTISSAPTIIHLNSAEEIQTPDAANISMVSLLMPAAQTHTSDMNQKFVEIPFTKQSGKIVLNIPSNKNIVPPGYYMLFIVNSNGVPSVAKMVRATDQPAPTITPTPSPTLTPSPSPTPTRTPTPTITPTRTPTPTVLPTATPIVTPTKSPTPTLPQPTVTPTKAPTIAVPTPTASPTPTSGPTPTAAPTPTLAPTITQNPEVAKIAVTAFLHGVGKGGDNANPTSVGNMNPVRKQRTFDVQIYNMKLEQVGTVSSLLSYNQHAGNYEGTINMPPLPSGQYQFYVGASSYLRKYVPGAFSLASQTETKLTAVSLTAGDINRDNRLSVVDYNLLIDCYSDLAAARNCNADKKLLADLNDDGFVNAVDYNLFLRELAVQSGQ